MSVTDQNLLDHITIDPKVMVGKPVIRGTRLTVEYILKLLARGATEQEILDEYDGLTVEDIRACLLFAASPFRQTVMLQTKQDTRNFL
jgi:uncharacterized protein (DUF433 family)